MWRALYVSINEMYVLAHQLQNGLFQSAMLLPAQVLSNGSHDSVRQLILGLAGQQANLLNNHQTGLVGRLQNFTAIRLKSLMQWAQTPSAKMSVHEQGHRGMTT